MTLSLLTLAGFFYGVLWFLLILTMLLLIGVILLQEGKGGGLAEAFGGAGAETFGVKAHGINKFTAVVGGVFLVLCVVLTKVHLEPTQEELVPSFTPEAERPDPNDPREILKNLVVPPGGAGAGAPPAGGAGVVPPPGGGAANPAPGPQGDGK